jgi:hypothetical protein
MSQLAFRQDRFTFHASDDGRRRDGQQSARPPALALAGKKKAAVRVNGVRQGGQFAPEKCPDQWMVVLLHLRILCMSVCKAGGAAAAGQARNIILASYRSAAGGGESAPSLLL